MPRGKSARRSVALGLTIGLAALMAPSSAGAAVQIGETFVPDTSCSAPVTYIQSSSPGGQYTVPSAGVITSWSYQATSSVPQLKFKVARPVGGNNFLIVGEEGPRTPDPGDLETYPAQISVQAGDVIGLYFATTGSCIRMVGSGYLRHSIVGDPAVGTAPVFNGPFAAAQWDVSALLEPDADNDGFGDETQDACPTDASTQADCAPPDTSITKGPKPKTKKKSATFEFSSSEPGSTFECSLDGGPFSACTSPDTVKVKKGKHTFQVRAIDLAGNVGTPAGDDWKVKKRRSRR